MKTVTLSISSCTKCPFFMVSNSYSTDGYDMVEDWFCNKSNKHISKCVEWHRKIEIPDWCPLDSSTDVKTKSLKDLTPEECVHIAKIIEPSKNWVMFYYDSHTYEGFDIIQENVSILQTSIVRIDYSKQTYGIRYYDERKSQKSLPTHTLNKIEEYLKQINKNG